MKTLHDKVYSHCFRFHFPLKIFWYSIFIQVFIHHIKIEGFSSINKEYYLKGQCDEHLQKHVGIPYVNNLNQKRIHAIGYFMIAFMEWEHF